MLKGGGKSEIKITLKTSKRHSKEFLDKISNKRIDIITSIILRLAGENKI